MRSSSSPSRTWFSSLVDKELQLASRAVAVASRRTLVVVPAGSPPRVACPRYRRRHGECRGERAGDEPELCDVKHCRCPFGVWARLAAAAPAAPRGYRGLRARENPGCSAQRQPGDESPVAGDGERAVEGADAVLDLLDVVIAPRVSTVRKPSAHVVRASTGPLLAYRASMTTR